jgi:hypothetical protein
MLLSLNWANGVEVRDNSSLLFKAILTLSERFGGLPPLFPACQNFENASDRFCQLQSAAWTTPVISPSESKSDFGINFLELVCES